MRVTRDLPYYMKTHLVIVWAIYKLYICICRPFNLLGNKIENSLVGNELNLQPLKFCTIISYWNSS